MQQALLKGTGPLCVSGCVDSQLVHLARELTLGSGRVLFLTYNEIKAREIWEDAQTFWEKELLTLALERAAEFDLPLLCAMTFGPDGRTYGGCTAADFAALAEPYHPAAIGLNCSCGAEAAVAVMVEFRRCTGLPLLCKPNMPPGHTPEDFVSALAPALDGLRYVGGCCGTTPQDIAALAERIGK